MSNIFKEEFAGIYRFLKNNANEVIVISSAMLFIILNRYFTIWDYWFSVLFYFGLLPLVVILLMRKNPLDYGLRLGNLRVWSFWVVLICLIAAIILISVSFLPSLQGYYDHELNKYGLFTYVWTSVFSLMGSEFMFRGFLLFGLRDKFKEGSIIIQMIPFAILHLGKPPVETISTIVTGLLFGYIAYKGNSFWPVLIIHVFINTFFVTVIYF
ncbi:MAG: CPBP family intramembrane metalloprotease [Dehalococcoidales bacterium]|nr:CPBP family intramembrane metalloprotease [Dehalococcoidales bacterium]